MLDSILADRELVILQLKFGTMYVVSRLLAGAELFNVEWILEVIYALLGLATYSLIVKKIVPKNINDNKILKNVINVNAIYGTMFVISRLLSGKDFNLDWLSNIIYILLGFTTYHVLIKDYIPFNKISNDKKIINSLSDTFEIFIMSLISQLLSGQPYDKMWFYSTLYTCIGFVVYNLVTSNILS